MLPITQIKMAEIKLEINKRCLTVIFLRFTPLEDLVL